MKKYLLFIAVLFNISLALGVDGNLKTKITAAQTQYLSNHFLNATFMFCDDTEILKMGANGIYSLDGTQLHVNQQMPIASTTKSMTAAGILKLQDQGLLNIDDLVIKHLSANSNIWKDNKIPAWSKKLKIHHLLAHRSGLPEYFMAVKIDINKPLSEINKDIANFAANSNLAFEPGEQHQYNNTNFILLGLIIEKVSGKPLAKFYEEELFKPLNMKSTKLITLEEAIKFQKTPETTSFPIRYYVTPTGTKKPHFTQAKADYIMIPFADGGVFSTTRDLIKWYRGLHLGKILSAKSYKLMTTKHYEIKDKTGIKNYMGYGLYIAELEGGTLVYHHGGSALAIRSESGYIPSKNLYYAVLSNVMNYIPKELEGKIDMTKPENQLDIHFFTQSIFKAIR